MTAIMTTKEEVLRLAEESGFIRSMLHESMFLKEITKLIELAKQDGAAEERDKDKSLAERIHYPDCWDTMAYPSLAYALYEMTVLNEVSGDFYCTGDECQLAIRNRERKE